MKKILISDDQSLAEIVAVNPMTAKVFDELNLNYYTAGKATLRMACRKSRLDTQSVLGELGKIVNATASREIPPVEDTVHFIEYLINQHHGYTRTALDTISAGLRFLLENSEKRPVPLEKLDKIFKKFAVEMENHMRKEENKLFPIIHALLNNQGINSPDGPPNIPGQIAVLELEHNGAHDDLTTMADLTKRLIASPGNIAAEALTALSDNLRWLTQDVHMHMHLENNLLFPHVNTLLHKK